MGDSGVPVGRWSGAYLVLALINSFRSDSATTSLTVLIQGFGGYEYEYSFIDVRDDGGLHPTVISVHKLLGDEGRVMSFLGLELDYELVPAGHFTYFQAVQQDGFWISPPNGRFKNWSSPFRLDFGSIKYGPS